MINVQCTREMRLISPSLRPAQWSEHPTGTWKVVGSIPAGGWEIFSVNFHRVLMIYFVFIALGGWMVH